MISPPANPALLSESLAARNWLLQFSPGEQILASQLIERMTLVGHEEFINRLRALAIDRAKKVDGPIGLFAERELRHRSGKPHRLFKQRKVTGKMRAYGAGPRPIEPMRTVDPEVGSEGIVASLITQLCRENAEKFISHPGPDQIRDQKVRTIFILTDFIGSGGRARAYLEGLWRVASVASWWSHKLMHFEVLAYSSTDAGSVEVKRHPSAPEVKIVTPCPTIDSAFSKAVAYQLRAICIKYDPVNHDSSDSLGYGGLGALIAFAHSCPNNAPRILHRKGRRWTPLFPKRVTALARELFGERRNDHSLKTRLKNMRESRLARGEWLSTVQEEGKWLVLVLAALRRGPRRKEVVALKTGLTLMEVQALTSSAIQWDWLTKDLKLTDEGLRQLEHVRQLEAAEYPLPKSDPDLYHPQSLRVPFKLSSLRRS